MTTWHERSRRKMTGGMLRPHRKKRKHQLGRDYIPTEVKERRARNVRTRGGDVKTKLLSTNEANVLVGNKMKKTKILNVLENPANIHFVRRNVITKGAIIETELGKAVVTSRPGQNGVVNAKIIEEES